MAWSTVLLWGLMCFVGPGTALLPQVSQEGLLRPYKSYADVTLFHYHIPPEITRVTYEFAAFMDNPDCPARDVYIFIQHGSYPVMSADNSTFPEGTYTQRSSMHHLTVRSKYQPTDTNVYHIVNPLPGNWFAAAYLPNWDKKVQQEGIGHRCQYSLGSIALWTQVPTVETIPLESITELKNEERFMYFKFYIPTDTWEFTLKISGCQFLSSAYSESDVSSNLDEDPGRNNSTAELDKSRECLQHVCIRPRGLATIGTTDCVGGAPLTDEVSFVESLPVSDSYYYLLAGSNTKVAYNVTITRKVCPPQVLGNTFVSHIINFKNAPSDKSQAIKVGYRNQTNNNTHLEVTEGLKQPECNCTPIYRLTRIKHAQDFSTTFLLEGREWFTTWLAITDQSQIGVAFDILPFADIGGTLTIGAHMDELLLNSTSQEIHVYACIRKSRPPVPLWCNDNSTDITSSCGDGLSLHVSSISNFSIDDLLLLPFPEPDLWFISFTTVCISQGKKTPCVIEEILLSLDVHISPCLQTRQDAMLEKAQPCGSYGVCQEVHKDLYFYTSCRCFGGYRGWACEDGSNATPKNVLLTTVLLLTLSNMFFIPAIVLAFYRKMFTHVLVYLVTMISSTLYHACDQEIYGYCLTRYQVLQFCDFFCSILAFWVTLIALAHSPPKYDSVLYMLGAVVIAIGVEYNRTGLLVFVVPFCLGIGIPIIVWSYRSISNRKFLKPRLSAVLLFLPGVLLGAIGLILFAFVETEDNYRYTHSAWHVIIALSLVYLLPKQRKKGKKDLSLFDNTDRHNTSELSPVSDYQNPPSTSPVFFITSDLDHLVHDSSGS